MSCSGPNAGNYYILNKESQLAVTFNGENNCLTVESFTQSDIQQWTVQGDDPTVPQQIVWKFNSDMVTQPGADCVTVHSGDYTWCMKQSGDGYIIMDPNTQYVWGVNTSTPGETIYLQPAKGSEHQVWQFNPF